MGKFNKFISEPNFEKLKLLSGKSIGYVGWDVKQEKEFLFGLESKEDDNDFITESCVRLIKTCIDSEEVYNNLSRSDLLYLLMNMRKKAKGSKIEFNYFCTNDQCKDFREHSEENKKKTGRKGQGLSAHISEIDLETDDVKIKTLSKKPLVIDKFKFTFKDISFTEQKELESKFITKDNLELNEFFYHFILHSIKTVEIEEEKITDFTFEDLDELIESLNAGEYKKLSEGIKERMSKFNISKKVKCPMCENESTITYENLFSILVF